MDVTTLRRNDPAQYDELADQWWRPSGMFAALHWLAASRAEHIPPASRAGALLVDLAGDAPAVLGLPEPPGPGVAAGDLHRGKPATGTGPGGVVRRP
jgi:hypothetical protein